MSVFSLLHLDGLLVDVLLVEEKNGLEAFVALCVSKLIQSVRRQRHLVVLGTLLL